MAAHLCGILYEVLFISVLGTIADQQPETTPSRREEYVVISKPGIWDILPVDVHLRRRNISSFFGSSFFLVEADEKQREALAGHYLVDSVERNRKLRYVVPVESRLSLAGIYTKAGVYRRAEVATADTCVQRPSHQSDQSWGSIRTSYRQPPDYFLDTYNTVYRGAGVDVYIVDTGVDVAHDEFGGRAVHGMVAPSVSTEGPEDLNGHGTHVAGTVAGETLGLAPQVRIVSCKVLDLRGEGTYADVVEAVIWVTGQVRDQRLRGLRPRAIINMSLSGPYPLPALYAAIQDAVDQGVIVIVAAGNDADDVTGHYPAAYNNTISVAAIDKADEFALFSNYGRLVDIVAPGVKIASAGSSNSSLCRSSPPGECVILKTGTSQAAPHVAGIVARYLSSLNDTDADRQTTSTVKDMLQTTASQGRIVYQNRNQSETPDRLLYRDCGGTAITLAQSTRQPTTARAVTFNPKSGALEVGGRKGGSASLDQMAVVLLLLVRYNRM